MWISEKDRKKQGQTVYRTDAIEKKETDRKTDNKAHLPFFNNRRRHYI